jgi:hypothetical protein
MTRKPKTKIVVPDPALETELARRIAAHHVHVAGRVLSDALPYVPFSHRQLWTALTGQLTTMDRQISELADPKLVSKNLS